MPGRLWEALKSNSPPKPPPPLSCTEQVGEDTAQLIRASIGRTPSGTFISE